MAKPSVASPPERSDANRRETESPDGGSGDGLVSTDSNINLWIEDIVSELIAVLTRIHLNQNNTWEQYKEARIESYSTLGKTPVAIDQCPFTNEYRHVGADVQRKYNKVSRDHFGLIFSPHNNYNTKQHLKTIQPYNSNSPHPHHHLFIMPVSKTKGPKGSNGQDPGYPLGCNVMAKPTSPQQDPGYPLGCSVMAKPTAPQQDPGYPLGCTIM